MYASSHTITCFEHMHANKSSDKTQLFVWPGSNLDDPHAIIQNTDKEQHILRY